MRFYDIPSKVVLTVHFNACDLTFKLCQKMFVRKPRGFIKYTHVFDYNNESRNAKNQGCYNNNHITRFESKINKFWKMQVGFCFLIEN